MTSISGVRILLTARDPASWEAIAFLGGMLVDDGRIEVVLASQSPATPVLAARKGIAHRQISVPEFTSDQELLNYAETVLDKVLPDIVIASISGPDHGIDEAILAAASGRFHTYALQNFWGDINSAFSAMPDTYLVIDDFAADVTYKRTGRQTQIIGSLKHARYDELDVSQLRHDFRQKYNPENKTIIGLFGQPFDDGHGYYNTIKIFVEATATYMPEALIMWRPHPKQTSLQRDKSCQFFDQYGVSYKQADETNIEKMLCGVDIVASAYSTCGYDLQQLLRISEMPLGLPLYLMFEPKLKKRFSDYSGLDTIPMTQKGMAQIVESENDLPYYLNPSELIQKQQNCWQKIRHTFPEISHNIVSVVDRMITLVGKHQNNA